MQLLILFLFSVIIYLSLLNIVLDFVFVTYFSCVFTLDSRFDNLFFMSSNNTVASVVSCKSGNKNDFLWILVCLLPNFLGSAIVYVNFLLITAVDRSPSAVCILESFP